MSGRWRFRLDRFGRALLAIVIIALTVRLGYVLVGKGGECLVTDPGTGEIISSPTDCPSGPEGQANDATYYNAAANLLARGEGMVDPFRPDREAADHPPLTVWVLTPVSWIGDNVVPAAVLDDLTNVFLHRLTMAVLGTAVVAVVGLIGKRVGGRRVGLVAAALAAIYPGLWISDALIFAETVTNLAVVVTLLAALRAREAPTLKRFVVVGVGVGACALGRAELVLFVPLLAVALFDALRPGQRIRSLAALGGATLLTLAPWVVYNNARFDRPTILSTNDGLALAASNCLPVYGGDTIGLTLYDAAPVDAPPEEKASDRYCIENPEPPGDQSEVSAVYRSRALRIMRDHLDQQPAVIAARVGRTWNVFRPFDMVWYNEGEDREPWATRAAIWSFYPIAVAAMAGAFVLRRRDRSSGAQSGFGRILAVPLVSVTIASALTYGQARYRAVGEAALVVLAAVAVDACVSARGARRADVPEPTDVRA